MDTASGHVQVRPRAPWTFLRHLLEFIVVMIVAMYGGMLLVGPALSKVVALFGRGHALDGEGASILLMVAYMVGGVVAWMAFRRYQWRAIIEVAVALLVPYIVFVGPFVMGTISAEAFTTAMHALMLSLMILAMLHQRGEFEVARPRIRGALTR
jgi:hypothetical protein